MAKCEMDGNIEALDVVSEVHSLSVFIGRFGLRRTSWVVDVFNTTLLRCKYRMIIL